MVGRLAARAVEGVGKLWEALAQLVAVEVFCAAEPRPDRVGRVVFERAPVVEPPGEEGCFAAGVDDPFRADGLHLVFYFCGDGVVALAVQLDVADVRRAPEFAAGVHRFFEHVWVQQRAVELVGGQAHLVVGADLRAVAHAVVLRRVEPHAQAVFGDLFPGEVVVEAEDFRQEAGGDF